MNEVKDLTPEELAIEERSRKMAILKASNEMLRQAKEKALSKTDDPVRRANLGREFDKAIDFNREMGFKSLHADDNEINSAAYRNPSREFIDKYNRRLEKKGITDDDMHRKESATVTIGDGNVESAKRRRRRRDSGNESDGIVRLENEDEIMNSTLIKSDEELERHIREKNKVDDEIIAKKNTKSEKAAESRERRARSNKIDTGKVTDQEHVTVEKKPVIEGDDGVKVQNKAVSNGQKRTEKPKAYEFDFSSIPSYVQYDIIPLPSNGECYPHKKDRVAVRYLTASDENIIASPNMYRNGNLIDTILNRTILDKDFKVSELCKGDRDAIVLWLRATAYGLDFPVSVANPNDRTKRYDISINLSEFKYKPFELKGDKDGLFEHVTDGGDVIKYRLTTNDDDEKLRDEIISKSYDINLYHILENVVSIEHILPEIKFENEQDNKDASDCIEDLKDILSENQIEVDNREEYADSITSQMKMYTVSVNGNDDREFVDGYIENMRSKDALKYRKYVKENTPGVNFTFTVNIPEADGGGSFLATFRYDNTIFINV